ncbi:DUF397 domain-containing protein [Microbispora sp. NBRC 16548]|uniref:DUF397 domain-containing protein n=1 Tax=Microbispora sp. NBRC 16548 TaxID=3030994 RepID=UPI0024A5750F|nr:DUF397 domain-containing protein [Microbispora sp. NBRC 16548]GLX10698.1 transcriptional regulator [Microbispora sp. NBRC 16548]
MSVIYNGMPSSHLGQQAWRKSRHSNPSGNCVEIAVLPDGRVALRNSRHPAGPALIVPLQDMAAFLRSAKEGEFDDLLLGEVEK